MARSHLNTAPIIFISKIWEVQDIRFLPCNFRQDRPINFGHILIRVFSRICVPKSNLKMARLYLNTAPIILIFKIWELQDIWFVPCNFQQDRPINLGDILIRDFSRIRFSPFIPGTIITRLNRCLKITMSEKSYRNHCKSKNRDFRKSHYLQWKTWFPAGSQIGIEKT